LLNLRQASKFYPTDAFLAYIATNALLTHMLSPSCLAVKAVH
jgi:hypothetical protein